MTVAWFLVLQYVVYQMYFFVIPCVKSASSLTLPKTADFSPGTAVSSCSNSHVCSFAWQGTLPHGIDILTKADYYEVGKRKNSYLAIRWVEWKKISNLGYYHFEQRKSLWFKKSA